MFLLFGDIIAEVVPRTPKDAGHQAAVSCNKTTIKPLSGVMQKNAQCQIQWLNKQALKLG